MKYIGFTSSKVHGIKAMPFYLLAFLLFTFTGCIDEYEADIAEEDAQLLVVEGTICSGKLNTFYLSRTVPLKSYSSSWYMDAWVTVRGTDGSEYVTENNYGCFTCQLGDLNPDVEYYLHIEADGDIYESEPQKPLPTEKVADVRGVQADGDSDIEVLITPAEPTDKSKAHYYSWRFDETWEVHPEYITDVYYDVDEHVGKMKGGQFPVCGWKDATSEIVIIGSSTSYENQHIKRLKLYDVDHTDQRMYYKYSGLIHQRAISKGEYEYEQARRQASEEMGGLFTPQPSALPSNIRCLTSKKHVIGYVGCSLNTSDYRFFLNAKDYYVVYPRKKSPLLELTDPTDIDCMELLAKGMFLVKWQDEREMLGSLETAWAYQHQLDVRLHGCYIEKPDYWDSEENISY